MRIEILTLETELELRKLELTHLIKLQELQRLKEGNSKMKGNHNELNPPIPAKRKNLPTSFGDYENLRVLVCDRDFFST